MKIIEKNTTNIVRVIALYRVSTKGQVHKAEDDIPMQRIACQDFVATKANWVIVDEKYEKGVSGSKVSAEKRDAIQELKEKALNNEFDVLLVWKFDRLGRIEDETPFVLKWFVETGGVQVWSTIEGQRIFETSVDDLINYITFWQAGAESKNTAIRIKERMQQLKAEGLYTGGPVPLGFKAVHRGRLNKKGQPVPDVEIDLETASIVREKIFYRLHNDGFGAYVITDMLRAEGVKGVGGKLISVASVKRMLRNTRYRGTIIDVEVFDQVQNILDQRANANSEIRHYNLSSKGKALLAGNIFCGHCGSRMTTRIDKNKWTTKDGVTKVVSYLKYTCYRNNRKQKDCDGQTVYNTQIIDNLVEQTLKSLFSQLCERPQDSVLKLRYEGQVANIKQKKRLLEKDLLKDRERYERLKQEIANSLMGESVFEPEVLNEQMRDIKAKITQAERECDRISEELADKKISMETIIPMYNRFKGWAEEYDNLPLVRKKMIACELIERVELRRGYDVVVKLNVQYEQFCMPQVEEIALLRA